MNRLGENEPNATLATYRTLNGKGVIFGMYFQMEIMSKQEYAEICPRQNGFESYEALQKANPVEVRKADGEHYIRVSSSDLLKVRRQEARDWR